MMFKHAKPLVTGLAVAAAIAAAASGSTATTLAQPADHVRSVAFGAPLPEAPGTAIPTATQLVGLLNTLADPSVSFANKGNLVEGGLSGTEAHMADHQMNKAAKNGALPLAFSVANIQAGGPGAATADVSVSGPKLSPPVTTSVTFVNQGGWMLSRASAMELLQAAGH